MKYDAKAIEEMIEAYLPEETGHQKTVLAAMNYAVKAGGKRLRPMMLRLCYEMFGKGTAGGTGAPIYGRQWR